MREGSIVVEYGMTGIDELSSGDREHLKARIKEYFTKKGRIREYFAKKASIQEYFANECELRNQPR